MKTVVIDTYVLVSAPLVRSPPDSPPRQVLAAALRREFVCLLSTALLTEYQQVFRRDAIARLHGLTTGEIDQIVRRIVAVAIMVEPQEATVKSPDPNDQHVVDLVLARPDVLLITGDRGLLGMKALRGRVLEPRNAVVRLWSAASHSANASASATSKASGGGAA